MKTLKWTLLLPAVVAACSSDVTGPTAGMAPPTPSFAVTLDPTTGLGFVGKGDVQYTFGWNNKALQDNAATVEFQFASSIVTEVSWTCTNANNQNTQERERTTTTSVQGLLSSVGRERNQITGFLLTGLNGSSSSSTTTDGPPLNSCPSGPWSLTTPAGAPEVIGSSEPAMQVRFGGGAWTALLSPPTI